MEFQIELLRDFYSNLATLFYAIAASDKIVKPEEYATLIDVLKNEWHLGETQKQIIITRFQHLNNTTFDSEDCFKKFILYKEVNPHLFNDAIKHLILVTAYKIASSFSNKNKSELIILTKLNIALKKAN